MASLSPEIKVQTQDRISYSCGRKISDGNYGSVDVHFSYSSDIGSNETKEEATGRVMEYVEGVVREKMNKIKTNLKK